jgi:hypothetical protein
MTKNKIIFALIIISLFAGYFIYTNKHNNAKIINPKEEENTQTLFIGQNGLFAWRILPNGTSTNVVYTDDVISEEISVYTSNGKCIVENMFDAPLVPVKDLEFPIVKCSEDGRFVYIANFVVKGITTIKKQITNEDCKDFSTCGKFVSTEIIK